MVVFCAKVQAAQEEMRPVARAFPKRLSWRRFKHFDLLYDTPQARLGLTWILIPASLLAEPHERGPQLVCHSAVAVLLGLTDPRWRTLVGP